MHEFVYMFGRLEGLERRYHVTDEQIYSNASTLVASKRLVVF